MSEYVPAPHVQEWIQSYLYSTSMIHSVRRIVFGHVPPDILKVGTIAEKESNEKPKHKSTHSQTSLSYGKTYP
jgi:hypothetical protein